jgi:hypothetical protein
METEIASLERGELPLSNDTNFNFITSLVDIITGNICINYDIKNVAIMHKRFKYVNNFMNVTERNGFYQQVADVSCM